MFLRSPAGLVGSGAHWCMVRKRQEGEVLFLKQQSCMKLLMSCMYRALLLQLALFILLYGLHNLNASVMKTTLLTWFGLLHRINLWHVTTVLIFLSEIIHSLSHVIFVQVGWYSPFLLACFDPATETFQSVCRCMSGFTDAFYVAAKARMGAQVIPGTFVLCV
jgi:hypothetical protein